MQPNDIGMDEWMELTRIIGVDPYVTVNAGLGDANSAAEEVEYLNGPATSEWGAKRAANGHPAPYARQILEHRQRALWLVADRQDLARLFHAQAQPLRRGDARGRPFDHPDRVGRDARPAPSAGRARKTPRWKAFSTSSAPRKTGPAACSPRRGAISQA